MLSTGFKCVCVVSAVMLAGCGLKQKVVNGTASVANAIFYKQITTLRLDFSARAALNTDEQDMSSLSVPTLVRVYQLRDNKTIETANYQSVLTDAETVLKADLLSWQEVVVKPKESASLSVPLNVEAKYVVVVGLFRTPDNVKNQWRLVIDRESLNPEHPRIVELSNNALSLVAEKE